jgi:hypothetical protein
LQLHTHHATPQKTGILTYDKKKQKNSHYSHKLHMEYKSHK